MAEGKVRRSAADWQEILRLHEASGESIKGFCKEQGIAPSSFQKWRRKCSSRGKKGAGFVELTTKPERDGRWSIEIELASGALLRLR